MMELIVNGKKQEFANVHNVRQLLDSLKVLDETRGIAVAVNDEVVPRSLWESTRLAAGDRIEVIHAVQGG